jgi:Xaa-Pro aminopeptidase
MNIEAIQKEIQKNQALDGWLLYDFHGKNDLIQRFLSVRDGAFLSRRFFYFIPKYGSPIKIVHFIDLDLVTSLPGTPFIYASWQELHAILQSQLRHVKRLAMEYSPDNAIPTLSKLDAGMADCIRKLGIDIVSSWPLLSPFVSQIDAKAHKLQVEAAHILTETIDEAFRMIASYIEQEKTLSEYDVQQFIRERLLQQGCVFEHLPICAVGKQSAIPHYCPEKSSAQPIKKEDFVLIDAWCKKNEPHAPYADFTQVHSFSKKPAQELQRIYSIVYEAQERAISFLQERIERNEPILGYEVDDAARRSIAQHGLAHTFIHRTGHSIDTSLHGSGVNFDNFETHDTRSILPGTSYSIEPGIYLPDSFGVRLECNVYIPQEGTAVVLLGRAKPSLPHV